MKVAIKKDFLIREVAGEKVLIGSGEQVNFSKMMILNETAAFIVGILQEKAEAVSSEEIARELPQQVKLHHIKLHETATSFAEWYAEDNQ